MARMQHAAVEEKKGRVRKRWVDLVEPVLAVYNHSPHSGLQSHSPHYAASPANWREIFELQLSIRGKVPKTYLRRGTRVRIRLKGGNFGIRASERKNSEEIFTVCKVHPSKSSPDQRNY